MQLDRNLFVRRIVTGDETGIKHHNPNTKQQSIQWRLTLNMLRQNLREMKAF